MTEHEKLELGFRAAMEECRAAIQEAVLTAALPIIETLGKAGCKDKRRRWRRRRAKRFWRDLGRAGTED